MMNIRLVGFPLLLAATACATANTRPNLEPKNGPKANVYVYYTGGMTQRTVRTSFRVGQPAHVIVGRLGGDGRVEILYPESPRATTLVEPSKTYQAATFNANFDGVPRLFNYATRLQRSYGAKTSSYDGRGNGFVFVIATQYPMFTEALDDHGQWSDSLEAEGYWSAFDPRTAVKDFAEVLTRGMPYSLDFANAFTTTGYTGFADASMDCSAMIREFGYVGTWYLLRNMGVNIPHMGGIQGFVGFGPYMDFMSIQPGCGFDSDRLWLDYMLPTRRFVGINGGNWWWATQYNLGLGWWGERSGPRGVVPIIVDHPTTPPTPTKATFSTASRRPGFRNGDETGAAFNVTRPRFDGQRNKPANSSSSWAPPIKETRPYVDRSDRSARVNGGNAGSSSSGGSASSGSIGITRTQGLTGGTSSPAPVHQPAPAPLPHRVLGPDRPRNPDPPNP